MLGRRLRRLLGFAGPGHQHRSIGGKLRRLLKAYLMGIDGLRTHIRIVSILSLDTLRNGLGCCQLALRPFLCLRCCAGCNAAVTEPLTDRIS
jgi:hypothetical protein